jgi:RNA polymerase sigma-70 factor (ECF subfamily)
LLRIAHNRVRNYFRDQSRKPTTEPLEAAYETAASGDGPEAWAEKLLALEGVAAAANDLTPLQLQVCGLRFAAGLSVAETAEALGRSPGAIRNLQFHAMAKLRGAMQTAATNEEYGR